MKLEPYPDWPSLRVEFNFPTSIPGEGQGSSQQQNLVTNFFLVHFLILGKWLYIGNDQKPYVGGRAAIISPPITKHPSYAPLCSFTELATKIKLDCHSTYKQVSLVFHSSYKQVSLVCHPIHTNRLVDCHSTYKQVSLVCHSTYKQISRLSLYIQTDWSGLSFYLQASQSG